MSEGKKNNPFPLRVRIVQLVFLAAAVIATLCLAWWQWGRWQDSDGSFQNLGYAIQWPIFGIFFIVAYRKYMEYERDRLNGDDAPAAPSSTDEGTMTEIPEDFLSSAVGHSGDGTQDAAADPFVDDRRRRSRAAHTTPSTENRNR
ncbi:hypothetical protein [Corynebacterium nuruki]|uniref:hypothetical protein n=1 Tax=Corynebacterium nuruki TaxID=1032851 RepID=UPI0002487242|nr:hypothetical protein [Corynebacterium nuruki]